MINVGPKETDQFLTLTPADVFDEGFAAAGASPTLEVRDDDNGCDCHVGGKPTDALSVVLVSTFLWRRRRRLFAR